MSRATVGFQDSRERALTDSLGCYHLDAVSRFSLILPMGDPYIGSTVVASAVGYKTRAVQIAHGTGEVFESCPPERRVDLEIQAVVPNAP